MPEFNSQKTTKAKELLLPPNQSSLDEVAKVLGGKVEGGADYSEDSAPKATAEYYGDQPVTTDTRVEVTVETKREFIRNLLAEEPFKMTFRLFDGTLVITFVTRTVDENIAVMNETSKLPKLIHKMAMTLELLSFNSKKAPAPVSPRTMVKADDKATAFKVFSEMPTPVFEAVKAVFVEFEATCKSIFQAAGDPDFLLETAGVS